MQYFSNFPNVYIGEGVKDEESFKYRLVKNIFRKAKIRPDQEKFVNSFESYPIKDGETPASIASKLYGDMFLDWVLMITNDITDFYEQWPKLDGDLYNYCLKIYDDVDAIHHYETYEIIEDDIVCMKKGVEVNKTWRTITPNGITKSETDSIYPVSNYEHEQYLNERKRLIKVPTPDMVNLITEEFEELVAYEPNAEMDDAGDKKTPLSVAARFLDITGYVTGSVDRNVDIGTVKSYDNGPGSTVIQVGAGGTTTSTTTTTASTTTTATSTTTTTTTTAGTVGTAGTTTSSSSSSSSSSGSSGGY